MKSPFPLIRALCGLGLILLVLGACTSDRVLTKGPQSWAYSSWWLPLTEQGVRDSGFDRLVFFEIEIGSDGRIANANGWPERQGRIRRISSALELPLDLTLTIKDHPKFEAVFSDPDASERLFKECVSLLDDPEVQGIHLDFEFYDGEASPAAAASLQRFLERLSAVLKDADTPRKLSIFVPMGGPALYDRAGLALADWVVIQAYDAHWLASPNAGPVAPISGPEAVTWENVLREAMALGVPRDRILLSYPLYGYEWPVSSQDPRSPTTGPGVMTTLEPMDNQTPGTPNVAERLTRYSCTHEALSGSSNYIFPTPNGWAVGWFEGMNALGKKIEFLNRNKLGGIAFFVAGYDKYHLTSAYHHSRSGAKIPASKC